MISHAMLLALGLQSLAMGVHVLMCVCVQGTAEPVALQAVGPQQDR